MTAIDVLYLSSLTKQPFISLMRTMKDENTYLPQEF